MRVAIVTAGVLVLATAAGCSGSSESGDSASPSVAPSESVSASPAETGKPVGKANGVEELGPKQILAQARAAALAAKSVNMVGTSPAASLNLVVTKTSSDGKRSAGETTLKTRVVDGVIYVKGDEAYWTEAFNKKKAKKIGDKWVAGELSNPKLKSFKQTSTMKPLMDQFLVLNGKGTVGEVGVVQGQPAVPITSASGTTWIATTGKPYVLQITSSPDTGEDATVDFKSWNKKVVIKAPPKKQTISLASLA
jgi:hypothetical protein